LIWARGRRFLAGVLLIIPGPFSDVIALLLLLWPRPKLASVDANRSGPGHSGPATPGPDQYGRSKQGNKESNKEGNVIEGDFRRED
jgi:UPF0716 family protein affecting phage T7 exclusion